MDDLHSYIDNNRVSEQLPQHNVCHPVTTNAAFVKISL